MLWSLAPKKICYSKSMGTPDPCRNHKLSRTYASDSQLVGILVTAFSEGQRGNKSMCQQPHRNGMSGIMQIQVPNL